MTVDCIGDEERDHVAHLEVDFGELNLLSPDAISELRGAPDLVPDDVSVLTVRAASSHEDRAGTDESDEDVPGLSAGLDLNAAKDLTAREARPVIEDLREAIAGIRDCHAVTVCGCGAYALGAGLELAMACDVRVATEDAVLGLPEIDVGLVTGIQGGLLVRLVGLQAAKELIYTGEIVSGAEAADLGLVNDAVPPREYDDAVDQWVDRLAAKSPLVLRRQKEVFRSWRSRGLEAGIERSGEAIAACFDTHDQAEAMAAFLEGRESRFTGR
ncbi:MAG TPA: enoyl-CoA hydratase/isomerase family protein [Halobacteriales archaeon]|nr:enoyl-CoA hydratase/isomerase family protein [Halobacteriales archaeon]